MEELFLLCGCNDICFQLGICFCWKNFLQVYQNRDLVLTTTTYRWWNSHNININNCSKWTLENQNKKFNENFQLCKSGEISFGLLGSDPDKNNRKIFLRNLQVITSSIQKFDENIQFCKKGKTFLEKFNGWLKSSYGLDHGIYISTVASRSYFGKCFHLLWACLASICASGLSACFGPWQALLASIQVWGYFLASDLTCTLAFLVCLICVASLTCSLAWRACPEGKSW